MSVILAVLPVSAQDLEEYTIVAYKDTAVQTAQPDNNYGAWISAECGESERAYYSFEISEPRNDDPLLLDPPNSRLGFWYEADITNAVKAKYEAGITNLEMQVVSAFLDNASIGGRFYTREAEFNRPHMKIVYTADKKSIKSAKLYLFGGTSASRIEINAIVGSYDEMTVTYNTRPLVGERFGYGYRNAALSGRPEAEYEIQTVDGRTYETAMTTTMTAFSSQFPDEEKWWDIYDMKQIPTAQQVLEDFNKTSPDQTHPRILGGKDEWDRIRRWYAEGENEYVMKWAERVLAEAEVALTNEIPTDFVLNDTGSDMRYRGADIPSLGLAYQLTLDKKYADEAYNKMAIMANYRHWNAAGKDLNVGDCAKNVGTAYDLVYDALTPEQRNVIVSGIIRHVFDTRLGKPNNNTNNWNPVTNGGFGIAALAIMNEQPYKASEMIAQSVAAIPKALLEYYPDGSFPEGLAYWDYMTSNLFGFTSAMQEALGTSYGLEDFHGLAETGYFAIYMQGPTSAIRFKYGDDNRKNLGSETFFYLAKRYNVPLFAEYQLNYMDDNNAYITFGPYWCTDETFEQAKDGYKDLPRDRMFDGHTPVATMRSSWEDENALFAGIKGGYPQISHSDLDIGTFLVSALGVEWSKEYYPNISSRAGFPSMSRLTRYMFYAASPQGHNTLLFNPGLFYPEMDYGQEIDTMSKFDDFYTDENSAYAILDMSNAYRKYVSSARRGIALINNRREFLIQDEIEGAASNLTYWFMHTDKEIEVNGREAILTSGTKRLYCKILAPYDAEFAIMEAKALPKTPTIADYDEDTFEGRHKLSIKTEIEGNGKIAVWMVPLTEYDEIPTEEPVLTDLDNWPMPEGEVTRLGGVTVNGEPLEGFSPEKLVYDIITEDKTFEIEPVGEGVTLKKIVNPSSVTIECTENGKKKSRYVFNQILANDLTKIKITASAVPQIANSPENTLDNSFSTCWASQGEQTIEYDLGELAAMNSVSVAFYQGGVRMYNFKLEISADGTNWQTVFDGKSSGVTDEFTKYEFAKTDVRYVKLTCNGSNVNDWNNVGEVAFGYVE